MMTLTLEELKTRAEAVRKLEQSGDLRIYDMEIIDAPPECDAFIQATSPATVLKLLEMIAVLREGLGHIDAGSSANPQDTACVALTRALDIERMSVMPSPDILLNELPNLLVMRKHMVRAYTLMSKGLERVLPAQGTDLATLVDDYVTTKIEYMLALKAAGGELSGNTIPR